MSGKEADQSQQFREQAQKPFNSGEFVAEATRLTISAIYVENVHWDNQGVGDKMLLSRASAVMRQASASLYRAEWLLAQAQSTHKPSSETTLEHGQTQTVSPAPDAWQQREADKEKNQVKLTGRLVRNPDFKTTPKGRKRIGFELAEHHEDGTTTYHKVYSLDAFAERAFKKELHKGDLVEIRGNRQVHEVVAKDGTSKQVEQVYCYGVTKR